MEKVVHKNADRGAAEHGWLSSRFSFSFAHWHNPEKMGFGVLRVINDDVVAPDSGFGMHPHKNMEIITIVMEGVVAHKDDAGNIGHVPAGSVQAMSAGSGVVHSEYNDSKEDPLKLFQIWIEPEEMYLPFSYKEKDFNLHNTPMGETPIVAPRGKNGHGELEINQQAWITHVALEEDVPYEYTKRGLEDQGIYVFVIEGEIVVADETLSSRDAIGIKKSKSLEIRGEGAFFVFEVPLK